MSIHLSSCSFSFFFVSQQVFVSSSGIFFNSFISSSFFHHCSDKRRIFFVSGMHVCQQNSPVFQLMIGFCSCNQGKPKIIFCFPRPVLGKEQSLFWRLFIDRECQINVLFDCPSFVLGSINIKSFHQLFQIVNIHFRIVSKVLINELSSCTTVD